MIELRPYQAEGLTAIWDYFQSGKTGNPIIAWPTGTGKSICPAIFIKHVMAQWPSQRFLMITHVKELISQNAEALLDIWPNAPLGIYSAGLKQKESAHPIVYGGIHSMIKNPKQFGHRDIIFIDEAHLLSADDSSMYQTFLACMKLINPQVKVIGMSATPFRMGMGYITDNGIFTDIAHNLCTVQHFNQLLADGYLAPLIPLRMNTDLNVEDIGVKKNGEAVGYQFQAKIDKEFQQAVDKNEVTEKLLKEVVEHGANRRSWLLFASGIDHANHIADTLQTMGIDCASVHSKQSSDFNDAAISAFKNFELRAIVNYGKLTTGFNHPGIDLIAVIRRILSVPLWVQILGRGTRPSPGKVNCLIRGTKVLTNSGLVNIENITLDHLLWDGCNWVSHCGTICHGIQKVVMYEGLIGTIDHEVWTEKGWKTLWECKSKNLRVSITGDGRKPIRETENNFSRNEIRKEKATNSNRMFSLYKNWLERLSQRSEFKSRLSSLWQFASLAPSAEMVTESVYQCEATMHESKRFGLRTLWPERNTVQIPVSNRNGDMGYEQSWFKSSVGNRSDRQRRSLRNWKSSFIDTITKSCSYQEETQHSCDARSEDNTSSRSICRLYIAKHVFNWINKRRNYRKMGETIKQAEGEVWDILNAGPLHRFTAENILVSNCLALDFARNTPNLGPINDPRIPRKKGEGTGDAPVKLCPSCGAYNYASVRFCCNCGEEFHFEVKIVERAGSEELIKTTEAIQPNMEWFNVSYVIYGKRQKIDKPTKIPMGKPYIMVTYFCDDVGKQFKQNVFPEHSSVSKHYFKQWWQQCHTSEVPTTTDGALGFLKELRKPKRIRVHTNKVPYPEVLAMEF